MDLNFKLAQLLVEGNSLRSCSRLLGLTYKITYRKFLWLKQVVGITKGQLKIKASSIQFDELETIHHTKCKPLSIALVVSAEHELISAQVAEMPAKGRLSEISRQKYGPRKDERPEKLRQALIEAQSRSELEIKSIESDQKPGYRGLVEELFSGLSYQQYNAAEKKRKQDRLHEKMQKKKYDPLFAVNHKCALLRSHIRRLTRRSWCTTKKPENLQLHLDLFIVMQFISRAQFRAV